MANYVKAQDMFDQVIEHYGWNKDEDTYVDMESKSCTLRPGKNHVHYSRVFAYPQRSRRCFLLRAVKMYQDVLTVVDSSDTVTPGFVSENMKAVTGII